ncbi:MAG: phospholipase [Francisellaceae bacterium]|nr:phospholipase [Francisellaceae bacterium]
MFANPRLPLRLYMYLKGPEIAPVNGRNATSLIILFHGYGQTGDDILQLFGARLHKAFPNAYLYAPNAPTQSKESQPGFDWIYYEGDWEDKNILNELNKIEPFYNESINTKLKQLKLGDDKLILIGFSQGARVVLHIGLKREYPCAGIVCYSGKMTLPHIFLKQNLSCPKVLLIHGENDVIISRSDHRLTAEAINQINGHVEAHCIPELGHEINNVGIDLGVKFISKYLN